MEEEGIKTPPQISTGDEYANKAAGSAWDNAGANAGGEDLESSYEIVPRPLEETETPAEPAHQNQTNSWADDAAAEAAPAQQAATQPAAAVDDGFHEVERRRGGNRGGNRGFRGDGEGRGRGRGRGGYRGDRGGERGHGGSRGGHRGERRGGGEGRGRGGRDQPRT